MEEYRAEIETLTEMERELIASVALTKEDQAYWDALKQEAKANGGDLSASEEV